MTRLRCLLALNNAAYSVLKSPAYKGFITTIVLALSIQSAQTSASVEITNDIFLGVWTSSMPRIQKSVPVCVSSTSFDQFSYQLSVERLFGGSQWLLTNNIDDTIPYRLHWLTGNNLQRRERLTPNTPSRRTYQSTTVQNCLANPSGMLSVTVRRAELNNAPSGIYNDTLRLTISPL